jgi:hypothetical protein
MDPITFQPDPAYLASLRQRVEAICRAAAPADLPVSQPFYVIWASEIPSLSKSGSLWGLQLRSLDLLARPYIEARWRGRGAAILINDSAIARDVAKHRPMNPTAAETFFAGNAIAVGLHELAHAAEAGFVRADPTPMPVLAIASEAVHQAVALSEAGPAEVEYDRLTHRPEWIRASLHIFERVYAAGLWPLAILPVPHAIADAVDYGFSDTGCYEKAIGDEPAQRAYESLTAIIYSPAPVAFEALVKSDQSKRIKLPAPPAASTLEVSSAPSSENPMSTDTLLAELSQEQAAQTTAALSAYQSAVRTIASGKAPPPVQKLIAILKEAGKTREDLAAAIEVKKRRIGLAAAVATSAALEPERKTLADKVKTIQAALDEAVEKFRQDAAPINARAEQLVAAAAAADQATQQLHQSCDDEILLDRIASIEQQIFELGHKIHPLNQSIADRPKALALIEEGNQRIAVSKPDQRREQFERLGKDPNLIGDSRDGVLELRAGERMRDDANEAAAQLPALQKEMSRLEAQRDKLHADRLIP